MLRLKRLGSISPAFLNPRLFFTLEEKRSSGIPLSLPSRRTSERFLDIYEVSMFSPFCLDAENLGSKAAIEKERARIQDEMSRGYFADISEMKKHGGKIAMANKIVVPAMAAVKFPSLEVNHSDGTTLKLPITCNGNEVDSYKSVVPKATLLCLSFRASSQVVD
ncbi:unnamed protein product [Thlaspi arvense]|uniref:Uncharacterized protein n=1 Tax=Thlaspi arvense TaxID=13288 RepID=A0AAU9RH59_THLAR|nr:unnamed protein product [Thlaspi arvense]